MDVHKGYPFSSRAGRRLDADEAPPAPSGLAACPPISPARGMITTFPLYPQLSVAAFSSTRRGSLSWRDWAPGFSSMWSSIKENVGSSPPTFVGNLIGPFIRKALVTTADIASSLAACLKDEEQALVQRAARSVGKSVSEFVATAALEEAKRVEGVAASADTPAYEADEGPLTEEYMDFLREVAEPMLPKGNPIRVRSLL